MIRLRPPGLADRRARAAARLLDRRALAAADPSDPTATRDADAAREMARLWALTGAVAADPRIRAAVAEDLDRFPPGRPHALPRIAALVAAAALGIAGVGSVTWFAHRDRAAISVAAPRVATAIGQRRQVVLADRSSVALDTDSEVGIAMDRATRRVTLRRGRAFFKVAKDSARPFIVTAGDKRIRAVGTAFDVRLERGAVTVTVLEGTIEVTTGATPLRARLGPNAQLATGGDSNWTMRRVDAAQSTSWLTGRLSFVDESLATAVTEMNRYTAQKIVFRDDRILDARIVGVFRAGDTVALAHAIELNGTARIVELTPTVILVEAAR
ncbi:FecR family protein [Sphingomonas hylomeconis]|uniref:FecR family protein n=1 Tax=Sphingomonas hylomeconis TaxID=1395958 RepID=A0ABV7SWD0_9SPHN|nr:FecR domain-containing protein [Sphingomonas hylomeconis]